ncbi:MAG: hypothetical protein AAGJ79_06090, partial [Verrucomicrobiota bacterium]
TPTQEPAPEPPSQPASPFSPDASPFLAEPAPVPAPPPEEPAAPVEESRTILPPSREQQPTPANPSPFLAKEPAPQAEVAPTPAPVETPAAKQEIPARRMPGVPPASDANPEPAQPAPLFPSAQQNQPPQKRQKKPRSSSGGGKSIFTALLALLILGGAGAVVYFGLYGDKDVAEDSSLEPVNSEVASATTNNSASPTPTPPSTTPESTDSPSAPKSNPPLNPMWSTNEVAATEPPGLRQPAPVEPNPTVAAEPNISPNTSNLPPAILAAAASANASNPNEVIGIPTDNSSKEEPGGLPPGIRIAEEPAPVENLATEMTEPVAPAPPEKPEPPETAIVAESNPEFTRPVPVIDGDPEFLAISRDPMKTLNAFLKAETTEDRLLWIHKAEELAPELRAYYAKEGEVAIEAEAVDMTIAGTVPGTSLRTYVYNVTTSNAPDGVPVSVEETDNGYRVDWKAFAQFHDRLFTTFVRINTTPKSDFRVILRRTHYFGPSIPNLGNYVAYRLVSPVDPDVEAYALIAKESELGIKIVEDFSWGRTYRPIVELEWRTDLAPFPVLTLSDIVARSWRG